MHKDLEVPWPPRCVCYDLPRVRILIDYRPALRQRTGVGQYAHQAAAALARSGGPTDRITVFSSSWKDRLGRDIPHGTTPLDVRWPVKLLNLAWHRLEWPPVELLGGRADIVHSMHPLLMPTRTAARVVTIHDLYFMDHPENTRAEIRRDYPQLVQTHARRADAVVVVSEYTRRRVENRLGVPHERIAVCPPGAPHWTPRDTAPRGPILFVGTLEPRKNAGALIRAYSRLIAGLPDAPPLVLAGRSTADADPLIRELASAALAGRIRHVGYVSDAEREQLFRDASMLVLPSHDEGFGMPVLEAMSIGLPVIAANRGALPEVAGGAALLVDPDDEMAIAEAMRMLLCDGPRARAAAEAGLARARSFTWETTAALLRQAYAAAVERRTERLMG
jgi:glycosyltransferase involved in cell wall biosynthesis